MLLHLRKSWSILTRPYSGSQSSTEKRMIINGKTVFTKQADVSTDGTENDEVWIFFVTRSPAKFINLLQHSPQLRAVCEQLMRSCQLPGGTRTLRPHQYTYSWKSTTVTVCLCCTLCALGYDASQG
mmetsp:Transcript_2888/g.4723  ORF Transcript_2888/g.4723 Transcript_2888/m.4723 type:complete len:126 (+) Transcript_2888:297-674(+)